MRFIYTTEMNNYIVEHREHLDLDEATRNFNAHFGTAVTVSAMRSKYKSLGIRVGERRTVYSKAWPREVVEFVKAHNAGTGIPAMTALINAEFGTSYTEDQLRAFRKNHNLPSGVDTKFHRGHQPWTKGKHIEEICKTPEALERVRGTHYRKGCSPHNQLPVGTEIVRDGYIWVKVGEPNHWRAKHRIIYEEAHGERLGRDDVVIFLDGDPTNMAPENLEKINRSENSVINRFDLRCTDPEITKTGVTIARLSLAIKRKEERNEGEPAGSERPIV